ncbi:MAG: histidine phosphatase family protein [Actinomycetia bacterium]|nr:histidine phosphatase family protein [Actinomycetes bacterium]
MTRLYLVRHGRAAAGWNTDPDPGLDARGREQAAMMAARLVPLGPMDVVSSPLLRCQQTAAALAAEWNVVARIEPGVAEIPSPEGVPMADRTEWLRVAMAGTWTQLGERYVAFRDGVMEALTNIAISGRDAVVTSHFVAINAAIGAILGDDRLLLRSLDNCSVTIVTFDRGLFQLVETGEEADTLIR